MTEQEQLTKILTLVELTNSRLEQLNKNIRETNEQIKASHKLKEQEVKQGDKQFFNLVTKQGKIDRLIIIATASFVLFSPFFRVIIELISKSIFR